MKYLPFILCAFLLAGCVSQEQADLKMARGCTAAVDALLSDEDIEIKEVLSKDFTNQHTPDGLMRRVEINAIEKDGWLEGEETYSCLFFQEWALMRSAHRAMLVQVKIKDDVYGKKDGTILGNFEDFLKIVVVVDAAMAQ
jgi:hypothetical protein